MNKQIVLFEKTMQGRLYARPHISNTQAAHHRHQLLRNAEASGI
ncbi:MAG: hypothetical protein V4568_01245 [Pseudomonadota bacterium]